MPSFSLVYRTVLYEVWDGDRMPIFLRSRSRPWLIAASGAAKILAMVSPKCAATTLTGNPGDRAINTSAVLTQPIFTPVETCSLSCAAEPAAGTNSGFRPFFDQIP